MRELQHRERLASVGTLTAGIAHQINNPVGSILASSEYALAVDCLGETGRVFVLDEGRGMEPEVVERIFDPFYTTRLQSGGSGLGLSVAHGIVADHGGSLEVTSAPSKGTTMTIEIPLFDLSD